MSCQQCGRPAIAMASDPPVPLCLDCWNKLVTTVSMQNEMLEQEMNFLMDQMDAVVGLPRTGARYSPRRSTIRIEGATLNNIKIDNSTVGAINTGTIGAIETLDITITSLRESGAEEIARAIQELTSAVLASAELSAEAQREAIELISLISNEATAPQEKQKPNAMRVVLGRLSELMNLVGALSNLWDRWGPVVRSAFW